MRIRSLRACYNAAVILNIQNMDLAALRLDLEYITQSRPLPAGESLVQVLGRLDVLAKKSALPDRLLHYLSQRSYAKALAWLDNPQSPHHP